MSMSLSIEQPQQYEVEKSRSYAGYLITMETFSE